MVDGEIIRRIKGGDGKAFRALYELYFHKVYNYAHKFLKSKEDSREIAQDVFIKLWDKRTSLDPEQTISGLIFRITKFLSIDKIRKQKNRFMFLDSAAISDVGTSTIEDEILGDELHNIYHGIIDKLPPKRRLIFQLSRDKNMSYNEIAEELNISSRTVEAQIRLALKQIRAEIANYSNTILALAIIKLTMIYF